MNRLEQNLYSQLHGFSCSKVIDGLKCINNYTNNKKRSYSATMQRQIKINTGIEALNNLKALCTTTALNELRDEILTLLIADMNLFDEMVAILSENIRQDNIHTREQIEVQNKKGSLWHEFKNGMSDQNHSKITAQSADITPEKIFDLLIEKNYEGFSRDILKVIYINLSKHNLPDSKSIHLRLSAEIIAVLVDRIAKCRTSKSDDTRYIKKLENILERLYAKRDVKYVMSNENHHVVSHVEAMTNVNRICSEINDEALLSLVKYFYMVHYKKIADKSQNPIVRKFTNNEFEYDNQLVDEINELISIATEMPFILQVDGVMSSCNNDTLLYLMRGLERLRALKDDVYHNFIMEKFSKSFFNDTTMIQSWLDFTHFHMLDEKLTEITHQINEMILFRIKRMTRKFRASAYSGDNKSEKFLVDYVDEAINRPLYEARRKALVVDEVATVKSSNNVLCSTPPDKHSKSQIDDKNLVTTLDLRKYLVFISCYGSDEQKAEAIKYLPKYNKAVRKSNDQNIDMIIDDLINHSVVMTKDEFKILDKLIVDMNAPNSESLKVIFIKLNSKLIGTDKVNLTTNTGFINFCNQYKRYNLLDPVEEKMFVYYMHLDDSEQRKFDITIQMLHHVDSMPVKRLVDTFILYVPSPPLDITSLAVQLLRLYAENPDLYNRFNLIAQHYLQHQGCSLYAATKDIISEIRRFNINEISNIIRTSRDLNDFRHHLRQFEAEYNPLQKLLLKHYSVDDVDRLLPKDIKKMGGLHTLESVLNSNHRNNNITLNYNPPDMSAIEKLLDTDKIKDFNYVHYTLESIARVIYQLESYKLNLARVNNYEFDEYLKYLLGQIVQLSSQVNSGQNNVNIRALIENHFDINNDSLFANFVNAVSYGNENTYLPLLNLIDSTLSLCKLVKNDKDLSVKEILDIEVKINRCLGCFTAPDKGAAIKRASQELKSVATSLKIKNSVMKFLRNLWNVLSLISSSADHYKLRYDNRIALFKASIDDIDKTVAQFKRGFVKSA